MVLKNKLYKRAQIERLANKLLRDYYGKEIMDIIPPIKVDEIMELHLGLKVLWEDIFNDESILAGLVPSRNMIVFNDSLTELFAKNKGLENFTKAHEIGHWILHIDHNSAEMVRDAMPGTGANGPFTVICREDRTDWDEKNADIFAGYLLMPKDMLLPMTKRYKLNWLGIYKMAEDLIVPPTALHFRLAELGLLRPSGKAEERYLKEMNFVF